MQLFTINTKYLTDPCTGNRDILKCVKFIISAFLFISCSTYNHTIYKVDDDLISLNNWEYLSAAKSNSNVANLNIDEVLNSKDWVKVSPGNKIEKNYDGEIIWLKTKLPYLNSQNHALYIGQASYSLKIFINKNMIYQWGSFTSSSNKYIRWNQVV